MELQKVVIKVPVSAGALDLNAIGAEFTKWIQNSSLPGVLIDVADYSHMFEGPGVILVAHEYIFSLDQQDGFNGLKVAYRLNSDEPLAQRFKQGLDLVRSGIALLKQANIEIEFSEDQCWLGVADRLNETSDTHEQLFTAAKVAFGDKVTCLKKSESKALAMIKVRLS